MKYVMDLDGIEIIMCGYMDESPVYIFGPIPKVNHIRILLTDLARAEQEEPKKD